MTAAARQDDRLQAALRRAISGGAQPSDLTELVTVAMGEDAPDRAIIRGMVNAVHKEVTHARKRSSDETPLHDPGQASDGEVYLDPANLPLGVFLAKDLAVKYSISPAMVINWIHRGRLSEVGRVRGKAGGHGGFVAVRESDLLHCMNNPRKGGRPSREDHRQGPVVSDCECGNPKIPGDVNGEPCKALDGLPIYDTSEDVPGHLLTAAQVGERYARSPSLIRTWIKRGKISPRAWLRGPARGGTIYLFAESDVLEAIQNPRRNGRPPKVAAS